METITSNPPWVLFAAIVAAVASLFSAFLNLRFQRSSAEKLSLLQLAQARLDRVEKLKVIFVEYAGYLGQYVIDYGSDDAKSKYAYERNMHYRHLVLSLKTYLPSSQTALECLAKIPNAIETGRRSDCDQLINLCSDEVLSIVESESLLASQEVMAGKS